MSNWAELTAGTINEPDHVQIDKIRKDREKRAKIIQCFGNALKCVESIIISNTANTKTYGMSDTFTNRIKTALSNYERSMPDKFTLNDIIPPKGIQITIRMKENLGTIVTETGQLILNKNCIISGSRSELIHLVRAGHADLLY